MIIVNLVGGLGNQMFQYACGRALAESTGQDLRFCIDGLTNYATERSLELEDAFDLTINKATAKDLANLIGSWRTAYLIRKTLAHPTFRRLCGPSFLAEYRLTFVRNLVELVQAGAYLHGYWQNHRYFESHAQLIRNAFCFRGNLDPKNMAFLKRISDGPSIGIHVRRGDYVDDPRAFSRHGILSGNYYQAAIRRLREIAPSAHIFAFSDEPEWVRYNILSQIENSECVTHNSGLMSFRDMQLMSLCDYVVIANSTFSWWAAWLNNNPGKIVIAPQSWFSDAALNMDFILPAEWVQI